MQAVDCLRLAPELVGTLLLQRLLRWLLCRLLHGSLRRLLRAAPDAGRARWVSCTDAWRAAGARSLTGTAAAMAAAEHAEDVGICVVCIDVVDQAGSAKFMVPCRPACSSWLRLA